MALKTLQKANRNEIALICLYTTTFKIFSAFYAKILLWSSKTATYFILTLNFCRVTFGNGYTATSLYVLGLEKHDKTFLYTTYNTYFKVSYCRSLFTNNVFLYNSYVRQALKIILQSFTDTTFVLFFRIVIHL